MVLFLQTIYTDLINRRKRNTKNFFSLVDNNMHRQDLIYLYRF